ncbi:hypothetical protein [Nitrospirillum viridazoti]|uniref:hypothetical protein n=1 Tax=Nitrospirillum viridazoti TaxID=3144925 RepID=UPI0011A7DF62|nr:hypothetical protein [Nitrospirillum amazonense]
MSDQSNTQEISNDRSLLGFLNKNPSVTGIIASVISLVGIWIGSLNVSEQIEENRRLSIEQRDNDMKFTAAALQSELLSACTTLRSYIATYSTIKALILVGKIDSASTVFDQINYISFDQRVYDANVNKIGMIDPLISAKIIEAYTAMSRVSTKPPISGNSPAFAEFVSKHLDSMKEMHNSLRIVTDDISSTYLIKKYVTKERMAPCQPLDQK